MHAPCVRLLDLVVIEHGLVGGLLLLVEGLEM